MQQVVSNDHRKIPSICSLLSLLLQDSFWRISGKLTQLPPLSRKQLHRIPSRTTHLPAKKARKLQLHPNKNMFLVNTLLNDVRKRGQIGIFGKSGQSWTEGFEKLKQWSVLR
jgi:hypothetical protein